MAARATFTLDEVIDELDGSDLFEEDESEDDFDGTWTMMMWNMRER